MLWLLCKLEAGVSDEIGIESVQRIRGVYEEEGLRVRRSMSRMSGR